MKFVLTFFLVALCAAGIIQGESVQKDGHHDSKDIESPVGSQVVKANVPENEKGNEGSDNDMPIKESRGRGKSTGKKGKSGKSKSGKKSGKNSKKSKGNKNKSKKNKDKKNKDKKNKTNKNKKTGKQTKKTPTNPKVVQPEKPAQKVGVGGGDKGGGDGNEEGSGTEDDETKDESLVFLEAR